MSGLALQSVACFGGGIAQREVRRAGARHSEFLLGARATKILIPLRDHKYPKRFYCVAILAKLLRSNVPRHSDDLNLERGNGITTRTNLDEGLGLYF